MKIRARKSGNSLAIRLPKAVARKLNLSAGMCLDVRAKDGQIIITPVQKPRFTLASLVRGINASNRHDEIQMDGPRGKELF